MMRSGVTVVAVGLVALFGYYFVTDHSGQSGKQKAKNAAMQVGDAVRDKGVATLVSARLTAKFGIDAMRFVHTYYDDGHALVYGLVPAGLKAEALGPEAAKVVGVKQVDVLVQPRPDFVAGSGHSASEAPSDASAKPVGSGG